MALSISELMKKQRELQAEIRAHGKEALKETFKEFFAANPKVQALYWTQYTPYFNDGESCEFGKNSMMISTGEKVESKYGADHTDDEGREYVECWAASSNPESAAFGKACKDYFDEVSDEVWEIAFGDHVSVTATRDGFVVEEYDHE